MYETKRKSGIDLNAEVTVNITLKELAIMYSLLCYTSTSDAQQKVDKKVAEQIDVYDGDAPYKIYEDVSEILKNNGVKVYV
jgi:hypothetical protein